MGLRHLREIEKLYNLPSNLGNLQEEKENLESKMSAAATDGGEGTIQLANDNAKFIKNSKGKIRK